MKPLIAALVAAAVLLLGALPALALVLDDDEPGISGEPQSSELTREHGWGHAWGHAWGHDKDHGSGDDEGDRPEGVPGWGRRVQGMPPRVQKCLAKALKELHKNAAKQGDRPGAEDSVPGDLFRSLKPGESPFRDCLATPPPR